MPVLHYFYSDDMTNTEGLKKAIKLLIHPRILADLQIEHCYHVAADDKNCLDADSERRLTWILKKSPFHGCISRQSKWEDENDGKDAVVEIGPKPHFITPFSTSAVSVCHASGLKFVKRLEKTTRYRISIVRYEPEADESVIQKIANFLHDPMVESPVQTPLDCYIYKQRESFREIDLFTEGYEALSRFNKQYGLALDDNDAKEIFDLFLIDKKRNPTNVELFDLAQSNSEHCRHRFFKGVLVVDGIKEEQSLLNLVMATQECSNQNNMIKFSDNSSAIKGFKMDVLQPINSGEPSALKTKETLRHILLTAETHNFPTGVCPFPGAATGTGGRVRDVHATGRGAHPIAGAAGYSVASLHIPGYSIPWEKQKDIESSPYAAPLSILIEASNGASDYGNKFGEPVICGFVRSFDQMITGMNERYAYIKPIMFSAGLGAIDDRSLIKEPPRDGLLIVKVGGPAFPIGIGGGTASSSKVEGENTEHKRKIEFDSVQRGDPEMEQKLNRLIRACIESEESDLIASIHDQGAGGNGNVIKELVEPLGAELYADWFTLGDPTMSVLELWSAEYQESDALLVQPKYLRKLQILAERERCICDVVGVVNNSKMLILHNFSNDAQSKLPFNLPLANAYLSSTQEKVFHLKAKQPVLLASPRTDNMPSVPETLALVLRLPSVGSKRFLTNKVDRSVTGLISQQQCVGPMHLPVADVAVVALSYFEKVGAAMAIGEQPIKILVNPEIGARMTVAECLTNLVFANITDLKVLIANWMWAAKDPEEGYRMLAACKAMCNCMCKFGIAVDGGKDSLDMTADVGEKCVKAPGTLVVTGYAPCVDICKTVTPDLKAPSNEGSIIYVRFGSTLTKNRLGGTALAQSFGNLGADPPDIDDTEQFVSAFRITQSLISEQKFICAGHDVSDGGLITCLLEMAFAGDCSLKVWIDFEKNPHKALFAEESAIIVETSTALESEVLRRYEAESVPAVKIGTSWRSKPDRPSVEIAVSNEVLLCCPLDELRTKWEETSYQIERLQCTLSCAEKEYLSPLTGEPPYVWCLPKMHVQQLAFKEKVIKVGIIREEGTNGDREMAAALHYAGFEVWDITMQDLLQSKVTLEDFRGVVFPGGFSYADVFGAAKGWASSIVFHSDVQKRLRTFISRSDTFVLGICNGCQLMATLGLIGAPEDVKDDEWKQHVALSTNLSCRFESRFSAVRISASHSIFFRNMKDFVMGVWVAHSEGRFEFANDQLLDELQRNKLIPIHYVDNAATATEAYPANPNGSPNGVAGICSMDGRRLVMMPHPERCFKPWQWPYWPSKYDSTRTDDNGSPWLLFFQNAYDWCCETK